LSKVFRGKYLAALTRLRTQRQLHFTGTSAALAQDRAWTAFLQQLHATPWVVYAKPPWGSAEQVLKYLSRYTHRVAIANTRLVFVGHGVVRFRYKDYRAAGAPKVMELRAEEFLRRFLLHVVPPHFMRIRHFGLVANRTGQAKLTRCRQLLAVAATAVAALLTPRAKSTATCTLPPTSALCPACGLGRLRLIQRLGPQRGIPP
jgi:Putative transposase